MASTGDPVCRQCRREGQRLYLKGYRCYGKKCPFAKAEIPTIPGQHGRGRPSKLSDYGQQLRMKQKLRRMYGLRETQFANCVSEADRRRGVTGENLMQILEMRLDNVVFRVGFASSRIQARQLISHGHLNVNGRRVHISSISLKPGDVVSVRDSSKKITPITDSVQTAQGSRVPAWLKANYDELTAEVLSAPTREEIDTDVEEALIVEFYSR